jgi:HAD superfamily hydrolase (TIGR01509 family)
MTAAGDGVRRYDAVVFDLFGTLVEFDPGRLPTLEVDGGAIPSTVPCFAASLGDYVPGVSPSAFAAALRAVTVALRAATERTLQETASRERFRRALMQVGCAPARLDEAAVVLSRTHHAAIGAATLFPPGRRAALARAAARGPVGLVSNFDDTTSAFAILARHAILPQLAAVVVSEAVGLRKPHPALLTTALATLGCDAARALFVGDSFEADVGAAHAVGADAAWIDVAGRGVPPGATAPRYVLRRLEDLDAVLGLGGG